MNPERHEAGLVSVIIPTFNRAPVIGRAIQSVLDQTYRNLEIIVVDDGSTDTTEEIVGKYQSSLLRYVKSAGNQGQSRARNRGVAMAEGEYIAFLDSDDYWLPHKLALQVAVLKAEPDFGLVYSNVFLSREAGGEKERKLGPGFFRSGYLFREVLLWQVVCHLPTWVLRRSHFFALGGFDEELSVKVDRDFMVRFAHRYKIHGEAEPLTVVGFHDEGRVSNASAHELATSYARILGKIAGLVAGEEWGPHAVKTISSWYDFDVGRALLAESDIRAARRRLLRAFRANPRNRKMYPYLLAARSGSVRRLLGGARATARGALERPKPS